MTPSYCAQLAPQHNSRRPSLAASCVTAPKRSARRFVHDVLSGSEAGGRLGRAVGGFIVALIVLSVAAVILETVPALAKSHAEQFHAFDLFTVVTFTVEYLLRVWSCTEDRRYKGAIIGRLRFMKSPLAVVDLLVLLPFFIPALLGMDLRAARGLRLARLVRMMKLARYSESLKLLGRMLKDRREDLYIVFIAEFFLLVLMSSLIYFVEHSAQPDVFSSIPAAMWWGVVTLTTVGYGDIAPITPLGKICSAGLAVIGIATFALPAGIVASGFHEHTRGRRRAACQHCGHEPAD